MIRQKTDYIARWSGRLSQILLILIPFHAFLTIWVSQLAGHYTLLRLWDEGLLLIIAIGAMVVLKRRPDIRRELTGNLLFRLIAAYVGLTLLLGLIALVKDEVTLKALGYGLIVNLRYLVWFTAVWIVIRSSPELRFKPSVWLIPAAVVIGFAVLQYTVLPHSFLSHFGYDERLNIAPIETINNNAEYIRVQSTLRGANPLGAYLIIPLTILMAAVIANRRRWLAAVVGVLGLIALYASGSRSAWIGTLLASVVAVVLTVRTKRVRRLFGACIITGLVIIGIVVGLVVGHSTDLQNALLHTQKNSKVTTGSNSAHFTALTSGLKDIVRQPFGDGPGTAGPASEYNGGHAPRIAEDYYIQIGQETGWIGLALFICILAVAARQLYVRRSVNRWAVVAFASLIGISFVNLLSHAWADDTLAYVWWGLAAGALGMTVSSGKISKKNENEV